MIRAAAGVWLVAFWVALVAGACGGHSANGGVPVSAGASGDQGSLSPASSVFPASPPFVFDCRDIGPHPRPPRPSVIQAADAGHVFALAHGDRVRGPDIHPQYCSALLSSSDGGRTWAVLGEVVGLDGLHFTDVMHGWLFGDDLFETGDGGRTWTAHNRPGQIVALSQIGGSVWMVERTHCQGAHPPPKTGPNATDEDPCPFQLMISTDAGATWHESPAQPRFGNIDSPRGIPELVRTDIQHAWALGSFSHGSRVLFSTADGGTTWQQAPACEECLSPPLVFTADDSAWSYAGMNGAGSFMAKRLSVLRPGAPAWETVAEAQLSSANVPSGNLPFGGHTGPMAVLSEERLLVVVGGQLLLSRDGGKSWGSLPFEFSDYASGSAGPLVFADSLHGWIGGPQGICRSDDGGETWALVGLPRP